MRKKMMLGIGGGAYECVDLLKRRLIRPLFMQTSITIYSGHLNTTTARYKNPVF